MFQSQFLFLPETSALHRLDSILSGRPGSTLDFEEIVALINRCAYLKPLLLDRLLKVTSTLVPLEADTQCMYIRHVLLQLQHVKNPAWIRATMTLLVSFSRECHAEILQFFRQYEAAAIEFLSHRSDLLSLWLNFELCGKIDRTDIIQTPVVDSLGLILRLFCGESSSEDLRSAFIGSSKHFSAVCKERVADYLVKNWKHSNLDILLECDPSIRHFDAIFVSAHDFLETLKNYLANVQQDFPKVAIILEAILRINSYSLIEALEMMTSRCDEFWVDLTNWIGMQDSGLCEILSEPIISRINSLVEIPQSFLLLASVANREPIRLSQEHGLLHLVPSTFVEFRILFRSLINTSLGTCKTWKLSYLSQICCGLDYRHETQQVSRFLGRDILSCLVDSGVGSFLEFGDIIGFTDNEIEVIPEILGTLKNFLESHSLEDSKCPLVLLETLVLDIGLENLPVDPGALSWVQRHVCNQAPRLIEHRIQILASFSLSKPKLEAGLIALKNLLGAWSGNLEPLFLSFLYEAGNRLERSSGRQRWDVAIDLRMLRIYILLENRLAFPYASKILTYISSSLSTTRRTPAIVKELHELSTSAIKLPEELLVFFRIVGNFLSGSSSGLEPDDFKQFLQNAAFFDSALFCEIATVFVEACPDLRDLAAKGLQDALVKCKSPKLCKKVFLWLTQNKLPTCPSTSKEAHGIRNNIDSWLCFNQIHSIRFCITHAKSIVSMYSNEHDQDIRNALSYTLQRFCKFLGLQNSECDVWNAFDPQQKSVLRQFLNSKYCFEVQISAPISPFCIHVCTWPEWIWLMFCKIYLFFGDTPDFQDFLKNFAAMMSIPNGGTIDIFSALVISSIIRITSFASFLVQEYIFAPQQSSLEIMSVLLDLHERIFAVYCEALAGGLDLGRDEIGRLKYFFDILSPSVLAHLAEQVKDHPRAIRFLEAVFAQEETKSNAMDVVVSIQRHFYTYHQRYNGDGLVDFFSPRDMKQQAYLLENNNRITCATDIRLDLVKDGGIDLGSTFDIEELLRGLQSKERYTDILQIVEREISGNSALQDVMKKYEVEANVALGHWEIGQEPYHVFAESCTPNLMSLPMLICKKSRDFDVAILNDFRSKDLLVFRDVQSNDDLLKLWNFDNLECDFATMRDITRFRMNLLKMETSRSDSLVDSLRVQLIKSLRHLKMYSEAYSEFLRLTVTSREASIELEAKLMKEMGMEMRAIEMLEFGLNDGVGLFKYHLKLADYKHSSGHYPEREILKHFEQAAKLSNDSRVYFKFAKFLDHDFGLLALQEYVISDYHIFSFRDDAALRRAYLALKNYSRALMTSCKHDVEVMPRFLTVWLDLSSNTRKNQVWAEKSNAVATKAIKIIQPTQFFRALPQLVSRILHQNRATFELLQYVFVKVYSKFPHATLWALVSILKSSVTNRQKRAIDLLLKLRKDAEHGSLCKEYSNFADLLISMANAKSADGTKVLSLTKDFPLLKKAVPVQVQIPARLHRIHSTVVTIDSILDRIDVIYSMQRPKKIVFKGTDGQLYPFLCKPNDDLRKDYRMIEMFDLVNDLYQQCTKELRRYLGIARFSVTALNEEAGLVEWVPDTQSFRSIILNHYKRDGAGNVSFRDLKCNQKGTDKEITDYFVNEVLPRFPIVFDRWMLERFPVAADWIEARNIFAGSCACISMLGYIVGLGDRHGENILIDTNTGRCVHVDFNCLFEKGRTFEVPELVPFRLTRNMVAGMGITEWRGLFLRCSEVSLELFRTKKDLMQTNLESFVYDPMVEWLKSKKQFDFETVNEQGLSIMQTVLKKISGYNEGRCFVSPKGQALDLIAEATDSTKLAKMYIGWSAFL